jgi:hypothetical protein
MLMDIREDLTRFNHDDQASESYDSESDCVNSSEESIRKIKNLTKKINTHNLKIVRF